MKVELNKAEQNIVKHVAVRRIEACRKMKAIATVYGNRDPQEAEIDYYGAELGFCNLFNVYPDLSYDALRPYDCIVNGYKIDVKQTNLINGRLMVKQKHRISSPEYYVLMVGELPIYELIGFMSAGDILQERRVDNTLPFPAHVAEQGDLYLPFLPPNV